MICDMICDMIGTGGNSFGVELAKVLIQVAPAMRVEIFKIEHASGTAAMYSHDLRCNCLLGKELSGSEGHRMYQV